MKYLKQFLLIIFISFLGEALKFVIPLPIPSSIYGLLILFAALEMRVIKVDSIKETSRFLIEIMPIMFIPAGVGLMTSWGILKPVVVPVIVIILVSTLAVMAVSGWVTQFIIRKKRNNGKNIRSQHVYVTSEEEYISEDRV